MNPRPGIGPSNELGLRVSVAVLARVLFKHPGNGETMLALEHKATLHGDQVEVRSQPFGGAVRILNLDAIHDLIGDFHFDSETSSREQDLRLFIRPSSWPVLREFCVRHLANIDDPVLETDPARELIEEFHDALKVTLAPGQFASRPVATIVEDAPSPTENPRAKGMPTVRVYRVFETVITDPALAAAMLENSEANPAGTMQRRAVDDLGNGGKGRANSILALPLKRIEGFYSALSLEERRIPIVFGNDRLDGTVPALLENITVPGYQRL